MKLIKQVDPFGCGVACVASLLKIGYESTLALFEKGEEHAKNRGFYYKEIVLVLKTLGLKYEFKYINPRIKRRIYIYKLGTIVFIRRSKKYPSGHYLLRTEKRWMDPWINFPQKPIKAGFRKRLPERPIYAIFKTKA